MMDQLAATIFRCLRQMDVEAESKRDGFVTGLNWYGPHAKPDLKKPQTEPLWSKRLAQLLCESGLSCESEVRYPNLPDGKRNHCDVVVSVNENDRLWLEIKGAWKTYWSRCGKLSTYRSYLYHPLVPGLMEKTHTAAHDVTKLAKLSPDVARYVGLLLIGFDSDEVMMEEDVTELARLAKLDKQPWQSWSDAWPDERRPGEHVRCWLWVRDLN